MAKATIKEALGLESPERLFDHFWKTQGFRKGDGGFTKSIQSMMRDSVAREKFKGFLQRGAKHMFEQMEQKQVTTTIVGSAIPLVFDPDILDIVRSDAPLLARLPMRGYSGDPIRVNPISARDPPIGWVSETASLNLLNQSREFTLDPINYNLRIYADAVTVGDFAERVAEAGPLDVRETALGVRISEWAQLKEQTVLYGDHSQNLTDGSPGDATSPDGMCIQNTIPTDPAATNVIDKSGANLAASDALLKDIKSEIKNLLTTANVSKGDLEIWTSHTLFDELENEMQTRAIIDMNVNSANYGYEVIYISGVPVIAAHNVREHIFDPNGAAGGPYRVGSEGDVFIMNRRANAWGSLAPLFMTPLARQGFADEIAVGEYGTYVDRAGGRFSKMLSDYQV